MTLTKKNNLKHFIFTIGALGLFLMYRFISRSRNNIWRNAAVREKHKYWLRSLQVLFLCCDELQHDMIPIWIHLFQQNILSMYVLCITMLPYMQKYACYIMHSYAFILLLYGVIVCLNAIEFVCFVTPFPQHKGISSILLVPS